MNLVSATSSRTCTVNVVVQGLKLEVITDGPPYTNPSVSKELRYERASAEIYINGERVGKQKYWKKRIIVNPGEINLIVKKEGYKPHSEKFSCNSGEVINKKVNLEMEGCILELNVKFDLESDPISRPVVSWTTARVFLDGKFIGNGGLLTPEEVPIKQAGLHKIEARKFGFKSDDETFLCESDKMIHVKLILMKSEDNCIPRIKIYENRILKNGKRPLMWAELYVDGLNSGWIKNKMIRFESGKTYEIEARKKGYLSASTSFTCTKGKRPTIELILTKEK